MHAHCSFRLKRCVVAHCVIIKRRELVVMPNPNTPITQSPHVLISEEDVPKWWPQCQGRPLQFLYRVARSDGDDFMPEKKDNPVIQKRGEDLKNEVIYWIAEGSKGRSPFLHTCKQLANAVQWQGRTDSADRGPLLRCDVYSAYKEVELTEPGYFPDEFLIDLSNHKAQRNFFGSQLFNDSTRSIDEINKALAYSQMQSEVLVKWRGWIPERFWTIVDPCTNEDIMNFHTVMEVVLSALQ